MASHLAPAPGNVRSSRQPEAGWAASVKRPPGAGWRTVRPMATRRWDLSGRNYAPGNPTGPQLIAEDGVRKTMSALRQTDSLAEPGYTAGLPSAPPDPVTVRHRRTGAVDTSSAPLVVVRRPPGLARVGRGSTGCLTGILIGIGDSSNAASAALGHQRQALAIRETLFGEIWTWQKKSAIWTHGARWPMVRGKRTFVPGRLVTPRLRGGREREWLRRR